MGAAIRNPPFRTRPVQPSRARWSRVAPTDAVTEPAMARVLVAVLASCVGPRASLTGFLMRLGEDRAR